MFESLSTELQNIILFNYEYIGNVFFIIFVLGFSAFYIFFYKKNMEKPTCYIGVGITRLVFTIFCYLSLFLSPFALLLVKPDVTNNSIIGFYQIYYACYVSILIILGILDFVRYAPMYILSMAGLNSNDPDVKKSIIGINKELTKLPFTKNIIKTKKGVYDE